MKRKKRVLQKLYECMELPEEMDAGCPKLTLIGREKLYIVNHLGVLRCTDSVLQLFTEDGLLTVTGEELVLSRLGQNTAFVCGIVTSCGFED